MKTITYRGIKIHQGETGCRYLMSNVPGITLDQAKADIDRIYPRTLKLKDKASAALLLYAIEAADDNDAFDNISHHDRFRLRELKSALHAISTGE